MIKKLLIVLAICMIPFGTLADEEVIELKPIQIEVPAAEKDPRPITIKSYEHDSEDIEKLARLLWSSPLRAESEKKKLVYVVMNRAAHGEPFDTSIQGCINQHEFSFFDSHAHRSAENLRIAREAMNEWCSRKEGLNAGIVRIDAYYIRFQGENNRQIQLLDINKNPLG